MMFFSMGVFPLVMDYTTRTPFFVMGAAPVRWDKYIMGEGGCQGLKFGAGCGMIES